MKLELVGQNSNIARIISDECLVTDGQSVLDLIATVSYETQCNRLVLDKSAIAEDFFRLATGVAGEVLQKCVNYHVKMAIVGDFSKYTSKPLRDFIYESNKGKDFFFVGTVDEAVERLGV
jgi:hypothetical protein